MRSRQQGTSGTVVESSFGLGYTLDSEFRSLTGGSRRYSLANM